MLLTMDATKYPIGIQSFEIIRNEGCAYADKTGYIHRLVTSGSRTYFLSRPRRFGKSLLLSTLEAYFSGRRDLFEGLEICSLQHEWKSYPVLHFDFSRAQATSSDNLVNFIANRLAEYEQKYGITDTAAIEEIGDRFGTLIERIHTATGQQLVILVDEYDKGIHEVLGQEAQLEANQRILRPFFSQIKAQDKYLRFCFITGVARFRNYTLFSGFNNPDDISMEPDFAGICGITETELLKYFHAGIDALSETLKISFDQTLDALRLKYDGYRFTDAEMLVYNPFSIITCLKKQKIMNYWVKSGTPKVFVDYLAKSQFDILELEDIWATQESMEGAYSIEDPVPLLFQTGYLTIAQAFHNRYRLHIPNGEVRTALVDELIPKFMSISRNSFLSKTANLSDCLLTGNVDGFMTVLQSLVAQIPYHELDVQNLEKTYHLVIYELFLIIGADARSEVAISGGRIDMVVQNHKYVYVIEFKLGGTPDEALAQIEDRGYALPWCADGRKVLKIGAVFSPDTRTLAAWKTKE